MRSKSQRKLYNQGYVQGVYDEATRRNCIRVRAYEVPSNPHPIHSQLWYIHERLCTMRNPFDPQGRVYAAMLNDPAVAGIINEVLLTLTPKATVV